MAKVFLIGFMASGKTTIGKQLAELMKIPFIDTDDLIVENVGMKISSYIQKYGEIAFRKKETEVLIGLKHTKDAIISTGGGMPCFNSNMEIINKLGISCYLCTGIEVIYPRIVNDQNRLLAYQKSKTEIKNLYKSRLIYYKLANYRIMSNRPPNIVAKKIVELISKHK